VKKLVSTNEAAQILGISVQGVHYRIKKGLLKSKKQDGKTFVYLDKNLQKQNTTNTDNNSYENIIKAKDEQISLLNNSIVWMKDQYISEIQRLSETQDKMMDVFKSEIELLKQAYNEMNNLHKLSDKSNNINNNVGFLSLKEFFTLMRKHNKSNNEIKTIIFTAIEQKDKRFIFNKKTKEIFIYKSDFSDLIQ